MSEEERTYFYRRAEEEIEWARRSLEAHVVSFHYRLGDLYLDRVFAETNCPWPQEDQRTDRI